MKIALKAASLTAFAASSLISIAPQANAEGIEFECQHDTSSGLYATVMSGSNNPMIVWTNTLDSSQPEGAYTPRNRCMAVSTRLTNLSKSLGITDVAAFSELGYADGGMVVFNSHSNEAFNAGYNNTFSQDEVVFTLSPENHYESGEVLERFRFRVAPVGGSNLPESALSPIIE